MDFKTKKKRNITKERVETLQRRDANVGSIIDNKTSLYLKSPPEGLKLTHPFTDSSLLSSVLIGHSFFSFAFVHGNKVFTTAITSDGSATKFPERYASICGCAEIAKLKIKEILAFLMLYVTPDCIAGLLIN